VIPADFELIERLDAYLAAGAPPDARRQRQIAAADRLRAEAELPEHHDHREAMLETAFELERQAGRPSLRVAGRRPADP
jgi:hypothetical protein